MVAVGGVGAMGAVLRALAKLKGLLGGLILGAQICIAPAHAERIQTLAASTPAPGGERRIALVVGNGAYKSAPLRNPVNDARAMARALTGTGFSVTLIEDSTLAGIRRGIRQFGDDIARGGVGLFYYAGHGMQVHGRNFLIPVNADIEREEEIEDQAVDANLVLAKMDVARNSVNILILDACRNNPFQRSFRSTARGLAQMDAPSGTLISFATAPGSVAADGTGENGLYTKHLLIGIRQAGLPIEQLFKQVRIGVTRETGDRQVPWESSSLKGDFYFVPPSGRIAAAQAAAAKTESDRIELTFWESIRFSSDKADFEGYLTQYPQGSFAILARNRIRQLAQGDAPAPKAPDSPPGAAKPDRSEPANAGARTEVAMASPGPAGQAPKGAARANRRCDSPWVEFKFSDGSVGCMNDYVALEAAASRALGKRTFAMAISRDILACPLITWHAWNYGAEADAREALDGCNREMKGARRPDSSPCACEILLDNKPIEKTRFLKQLESIELACRREQNRKVSLCKAF